MSSALDFNEGVPTQIGGKRAAKVLKLRVAVPFTVLAIQAALFCGASSAAPTTKGHAPPTRHTVASGTCQFGPGVSRWATKTSVPSGSMTPAVTVPAATFVKLPNLPQYHKGQNYTGRIPNPILIAGKTLHEGDIIAVEGYIQQIKCESTTATSKGDGDLHGDIAAASSGGLCAIVEVPNPKWITNVQLRSHVTAARAKFLKNMSTTPVRVLVTGQLFYDMDHSATTAERGHGYCAKTLWEVHPVIEVQ